MQLRMSVLFSLLVASLNSWATEKSYLIIQTEVAGSTYHKRPAVEITRARKSKSQMIVPKGAITEMEPGRLKVFGVVYMSEARHVFYDRFTKPITLKLQPGKIYFFGKVVIDNGEKNLDRDLQLIFDACDEEPKLFEAYPVVDAFDTSNVNFINCAPEPDSAT